MISDCYKWPYVLHAAVPDNQVFYLGLQEAFSAEEEEDAKKGGKKEEGGVALASLAKELGPITITTTITTTRTLAKVLMSKKDDGLAKLGPFVIPEPPLGDRHRRVMTPTSRPWSVSHVPSTITTTTKTARLADGATSLALTEHSTSPSVSDADRDNIFALVAAAYNNNNNNNNNSLPSASRRPFASMNTTISSQVISPLFLQVAPGKNATLGWVAFRLYSPGTLGGCANASLNGLGIRAASPHLLRGEANVDCRGRDGPTRRRRAARGRRAARKGSAEGEEERCGFLEYSQARIVAADVPSVLFGVGRCSPSAGLINLRFVSEVLIGFELAQDVRPISQISIE
ncbi:hypothetical protein MBM_03047 [Drepanopeziza brunnea f. sp. 'multigermtubi' MB_m1]|uniref:Uncharacterized protein n=1 Tax=Marssonina brunnea f. sp. multigermtubi (strain MB_m1) TaxID=1072389 RepID=K1WM82_MARBU|nr:uncharacterized protein MBM_03047 [Drepanopeziza brunnea f. sp. 'multigermtubi' MB_m1]EKD18805.1 hypothetical protein MBM_03047 [Drepanopeziza brunnea f. sp. 'multigermtubi' MB_m1]